MVTGYLHPEYAQSLSEFGIPRALPRCGGWILKRSIPGFPDCDAMGCYPLFACQDWSQLYSDIEVLEGELVSLSIVTDPFGKYNRKYLNQCFENVVPFKEHFIVDLHQQINKCISKHHGRYAQKALQCIHVEKPEKPVDFIDDWVKLYEILTLKHDIKGISAFSRRAFTHQLKIPGIAMFRAVHEESTVGILLWYIQGEVGYYHLGAYNSLGYEMHASFALFWRAIEYFKESRLRWLNLGGGAGVKCNAADGLSQFKRGWSTETRMAYFCGRIFDRERYEEVTKAMGISATDYFPAYRAGEFS